MDAERDSHDQTDAVDPSLPQPEEQDGGAPADEDELQFEHAEAAEDGGVPTRCATCQSDLVDAGFHEYFVVNGLLVCPACHAQLREGLSSRGRMGRAFKATLLGVLGGVVGAAIWWGVRAATNYELGIIAVVVGLLVGGGVRMGAQNRGGWFYQGLAVLLTYLAIAGNYAPSVWSAMVESREAEMKSLEEELASAPTSAPSAVRPVAPGQAVDHQANAAGQGEVGVARAAASSTEAGNGRSAAEIESELADLRAWESNTAMIVVFVVLVIVFSLATPVIFLVEGELIMLLIIAFALYEAWKINKKPVMDISGPHQLGAEQAHGADAVPTA